MAAPTTTEGAGIGRRLWARRAKGLKKRLVDLACHRYDARSIADCGGVWGVDGLYTFHALGGHDLDRAVLVDTDFTNGVRDRATEFPQLELIEGNFGDSSVIDRIRPVDAVIFYDVLLHQVRPDWDEILRLYAEFARILCVFNQQWVGGDETVRLLELGRERYLENVPLNNYHAQVLDHLDETSPAHGRPYRDVHNIWQWGITDDDLRARVAELGFREAFHRDAGRFPGLPNFRNGAFLFVRDA